MKLIAHRGLSSKAPENTMPAFELAGKEQRFYGIECDIHETKDHQFVISHDGDLKRMTGFEISIQDLTLEEVLSYTINSGKNIKQYKDLKIPRFEEYIELCVFYDKVAVIEIKGVQTMDSLTRLMNIVEDHPGLKAIFISFNLNYLKFLRALSSEVELQLLLGKLTDDIIYDVKVNNIDISLFHEELDISHVTKLKSEGFKLAVYTVNEMKKMLKFEKMGLDYLTTDR
jgi:glycerophosphoryl diester phosphodiesterase